MDYLNPFSEKFILKGVLDFLGTLLDYLNPFSENFILKILFNWIGNFFSALWDLFVGLFVPEENYFTDKINNMKYKISQKIPYQNYVDMFETVKQVSSEEDITIDLNGYQVGSKKLNFEKFIDFSWVSRYKNTWYAWVRGFLFVFLIIYNINQIIKLFRGYNVADGVSKLTEGANNNGGVKK